MQKSVLSVATSVCIMFVALAIFWATSVEAAAGPIFTKIKNAYSSFKDISGKFTQLSNIRDLNKEMSFDGTFRIKPPLKMSWRYEGEEDDDEQEVYINDDELTIYKKKLNQAIRSKLEATAIAQTPLALLRGLTDIEKDYDITEKNNVVRLTPKSPSFNVKHFDIYPSKDAFPIKKIIFYDKNDNTIELTLRGVKVNTGLSNEIFTFKPPEGVTIVDN
ncbi:MAG: outer-membrane lipoprotein carrier protein LolA [Nitrospirae bacterium]|nr:outer-membrane lipoprotein carrier protein LolA [Nitrospirota bacterium]